MKSFKSIPGPRGYLALQSLTGSYNLNELHKIGYKLFREYGPIVRQKVLPGVDLLSLFDPDDIATVANDFSKKDFPHRADHYPLIKYRQDRPEIYENAGLLPTNGNEWWRLRSSLQKNISKPVYIRKFISSTNGILTEFVDALEGSGENPIDIERYLANLNLELIVQLTFGVRFNALAKEELRRESNSSSLVAAAYEANSLTLKLDQLPLWKIWPTKTYQRYTKCMDVLHVEGANLLRIWQERAEQGIGEQCLMDDYAMDSNLTKKDLQGTAEDYLLAGTDTTSITTSMILYHISRNPEVQDKILAEVNSVLEPGKEPSMEMINSHIPYTRAVLKESLRLNPISIGFGRYLVKDMEIRGYHVPKKTIIVTQNYVASRLPENFHRPLDFIPSRWLKDPNAKSKIHTHLVLPFGHGMRGCIARRFAEQNMLLVLIKMVRTFEIKYAGPSGEMEIETRLINRPKLPVLLTLIPRRNQ